MLRVVEAINRLAPHLTSWLEGRQGRLLAADTPPPGSLPRDAFLSAKLAPKLNQQLKDVLSICGGELMCLLPCLADVTPCSLQPALGSGCHLHVL